MERKGKITISISGFYPLMLFIAQIVLLTLKLTSVLSVSWWIVFSPTLFSILFVVSLFAVMFSVLIKRVIEQTL